MTGTVWCSTRGYSMRSLWWKAATCTTRWGAVWRNGCGVVSAAVWGIWRCRANRR
ncbi:rhsB element core RshB domain protein [Salmonella enterica subsp. enterica]|nr:rhsB element core RshB domain protein [Salmonella enterica subsp. enterica]MIF52732.1 rhsB element core RshB domain protein [Salmonella enterica subsp. enterica]